MVAFERREIGIMKGIFPFAVKRDRRAGYLIKRTQSPLSDLLPLNVGPVSF
jgi:hypothetical protein